MGSVRFHQHHIRFFSISQSLRNKSQLASAGLAETGCSEGDYACACSAQYYLAALPSNIEQQCSPEDHAQVTAYTQELCAGGDGADEEEGDDGEYEEEDGDAAMSTQ